MIFAELKGKLGSTYSRAHERGEDLLTSTVFGLLRYAPIQDTFLPLLEAARPVRLVDDQAVVDSPGPVPWLTTKPIHRVDLDFWPSFGKFGEPDVVVQLLDANGLSVHTVLIECKLFSPKSGSAEDTESEIRDIVLSPEPDPDQLVKYWQGLCRSASVTAGAIPLMIYLTSHVAPPLDELAEAKRRCPEMRLAWLSWRSIWEIAYRLTNQLNPMPAMVDLSRLLAHKRLTWFHGICANVSDFPTFERFWFGRGWFSEYSGTHQASDHWRSHRPSFWSSKCLR
jgi:hypothetical protein